MSNTDSPQPNQSSVNKVGNENIEASNLSNNENRIQKESEQDNNINSLINFI